jgi:hypothetical protein
MRENNIRLVEQQKKSLIGFDQGNPRFLNAVSKLSGGLNE